MKTKITATNIGGLKAFGVHVSEGWNIPQAANDDNDFVDLTGFEEILDEIIKPTETKKKFTPQLV